MFLFREFLKSFVFSHKIRIGFILCVFPSPYYGKIMASTRLRVYDVINNFSNDENYFLELYKPWKKYDIVIFQKKFDDSALKLAKKLKQGGVKIILDINVNYYDKKTLEEKDLQMNNQIMKFTAVADGIITSTPYLENYVKKIFLSKKITYIPENITDIFFSIRKRVPESSKNLKLVYAGYAIKAKEILLIKKILQELCKIYNFSLLLICEKNPAISIDGIKIEFIKYRQKRIHQQILEGDIFIAPRDLNNPYNLSHSFTKIGYPMAVGIPVIASPIPSYEKSPALLCKTEEDWSMTLNRLLKNPQEYTLLQKSGIAYCQENFSSSVITQKYYRFFQDLFKKNHF